jgi:hypothetical protein
VKNEDKLDLAFAYFDGHTEEFDDDYAAKVRERAEIVIDSNNPDKIIFDVERHRAWLGDRYQKGKAMNSFITYWERYEYDPIGQKMRRLGVVRPSTYEVGGCADLIVEDFFFQVQRTTEGKYRVSEACTNVEAIVASLSEAEEFASSVATDLCFNLIAVEDAFPPSQTLEVEAELKRVVQGELRTMVRNAWAESLEEENE